METKRIISLISIELNAEMKYNNNCIIIITNRIN
jgi:hypothetical protein